MFEPPIQRLIDELARLPGIGRKSAQRLAFYLLSTEEEDARRLSRSIIEMREQVRLCGRCFNVTDSDECSLCRDLRRDQAVLCVVERAQDIVVVERSREFRGRYHVLGGAISPIEGIGPERLRFRELVERVRHEAITEVIIATNPSVEGDTTALYLAKVLKPEGVRVTRLASGLPVGGDLDYADELTLGRALTGRREM
ncbi:MAG: recombination mediator RecR [Acidimicrobiia bacterium]|nr:recombination mediator RecR [Acidimicrobiia bacterium]